MADIQVNGSARGGAYSKRFKKHSLRMDMTPMVDLAFLLLTFFVLTATFSKPKSMELVFPASDGEPSTLRNGITFLLGENDRIFYYEGEFRPEASALGPKTQLKELNFEEGAKESLHSYLLRKNKSLQDQLRELSQQRSRMQLTDEAFKQKAMEIKRDRSAATFLVKTDNKATYKNVIDVIDELNINLVGKYVVADISTAELSLMQHTGTD